MNNTYSKALLAYVFTLSGDTETQQQLLKDVEEEILKTGRGGLRYSLLHALLAKFLSVNLDAFCQPGLNCFLLRSVSNFHVTNRNL